MQTTDVDFNNLIDILKKNIMSLINCANIGKIRSFNPDTCSANIDIMQLKVNDGVEHIPTLLPDVPVIIFGGSQSRVVPPDIVGSNCLLIFMDRNIDNFLLTGEQYAPRNGRMHSYSDCVALLTLNSYIDNPIMYDKNALTMYNKTQFIKVFENSIELYSQKIKLYNDTTTLLALVNKLIDTVKGITVDTSTSNPTQPITQDSIDKLEELKEDFKGLLL